ncbi:P-loop containing nucleoside triphosphate hydrolase protein [Lactifluus volemus]|nr:P-loop containing nucleoside triphosphate hydrolase protein [Lactifluus volemus]
MIYNDMRTVKIVVIGDSGVGKTSLRGQYVSGHFSTGYRATIGTDFISKTLPHHSNPDESVTLQVWDTAGQERFSSLSTAFFRGADAALLMFDVNKPATLHALTRWWSEFRTCAPLADEDMEEYCLVVVGNKTDLISGSDNATTEEDALRLIDELVPPSDTRSTSSPATPVDERDWLPTRVVNGSDDDEMCVHTNGNLNPDTTQSEDIILLDETSTAHATPDTDGDPEVDTDTSVPTIMIPPRTSSIDLTSHHHKRTSKSHSRNSQLSFAAAHGGTLGSTHTGFTSFHTPASSFSDGAHAEPFQSALSSPLSRSRSPSSSSPLIHAHNNRSHTTRRCSLSPSTISISTAPTITPARYATAQALARAMPPRPPRGPKLFFTSAKTGAGVSDVFAYIAQRVVTRWEWEEARAEQPNGVSTVGLDQAMIGQKKTFRSTCCSS